jgi:predicted transglutaminase-like cysteine proteinase
MRSKILLKKHLPLTDIKQRTLFPWIFPGPARAIWTVKKYRLRKLAFVLPILCITAACTAFYQPAPGRINDLYYEQIMDWQKRIKEEGWAENHVDEVVNQCIKFSKYRTEKQDHWDTPKEFIQRGFQGDCEDIAIFIMATLKQLNYPYNVRIMVVRALTVDHAVLKVQMPNTKWKIYETVPVPFGEIDRLFYRPIVEFDEKNIIYFEQKSPLERRVGSPPVISD